MEKESIGFTRWKRKVDHHIRRLIASDSSHLDTFLYRQYYDNDFSPKVVAFLAVKNVYNLEHVTQFELWKTELFKFLSLFLSYKQYLEIGEQTFYNLYHQGLQPIWVAESMLQQRGFLPEPKVEFGISPPKY